MCVWIRFSIEFFLSPLFLAIHSNIHWLLVLCLEFRNEEVLNERFLFWKRHTKNKTTEKRERNLRKMLSVWKNNTTETQVEYFWWEFLLRFQTMIWLFWFSLLRSCWQFECALALGMCRDAHTTHFGSFGLHRKRCRTEVLNCCLKQSNHLCSHNTFPGSDSLENFSSMNSALLATVTNRNFSSSAFFFFLATFLLASFAWREFKWTYRQRLE